MTDRAVRDVLELVAAGRLTADEAGPILDALGTVDPPTSDPGTDAEPDGRADGQASKASSGGSPAQALRIEVTDEGRTVVNLRVPLILGRAAVDRIPGLSDSLTQRIREALSGGIKGPIVEIDDDGDGVRIVIE